MNSRFKKIRITLGLTQADYGSKINLKKPTISELENGKRPLSSRVIIDVCREFNVSEEWLRNGLGDMFILTQEDELQELQSKYHLDQLDIKILREYLKLTPEHRKIFKNYFINVFGGEPAITSEDEKIDLEVNAYREELEAEKRFSTSEVSPATEDVKTKVS